MPRATSPNCPLLSYLGISVNLASEKEWSERGGDVHPSLCRELGRSLLVGRCPSALRCEGRTPK